METQPRHKELKKLEFLIGKWHTAGTVYNNEEGKPIQIHGMDTYEWISGGCFILHSVDVFLGNDRTEVVEIIGYDDVRKEYFMTSYDSTGSVVTMQANVDSNGVLKLGNKEMRATLNSDGDRRLTAIWELFENEWKPWMEVTLTK